MLRGEVKLSLVRGTVFVVTFKSIMNEIYFMCFAFVWNNCSSRSDFIKPLNVTHLARVVSNEIYATISANICKNKCFFDVYILLSYNVRRKIIIISSTINTCYRYVKINPYQNWNGITCFLHHRFGEQYNLKYR